jgi:general secretion pathway protein I
VLVAFSILALALGVIMQVFSRSLISTRTSDQYAEAADVAESVMALAGTEIPLQPVNDSGEVKGYTWRMQIAEYAPQELIEPPEDLLPYLITVDVEWSAGERVQVLRLATLRLAPVEP